MLLYITVMVKPLIPIVNDWWQHEFNEVEHMSHAHAVYGSHHLQHEIADTGSHNDHCNNQNILKSDDQVPFHIWVTEYKNDLNITSFDKQFKVINYLKLSSVFIAPQGPPPKFV